MNWSEEEKAAAVARGYQAQKNEGWISPDAARAVMDYAVELVAARGGTMTGATLAMILADMAGTFGNGVERVRAHLAAQDARVATLVMWLGDLTEILCGERPVGVGVMPGTTMDAARALQAKAAALEERVRDAEQDSQGRKYSEESAVEEANALRVKAAALEAENEQTRSAFKQELDEAQAEARRAWGEHAALCAELDEARLKLLETKKDLEAAKFCEANALHQVEAQREVGAARESEWKALEARTDGERVEAEQERDVLRVALSESEAMHTKVVNQRNDAERELARLKPSGQVAEDVALVERRLHPSCSPQCAFPSCRGCVPRSALSRLATLAQQAQTAEERRLAAPAAPPAVTPGKQYGTALLVPHTFAPEGGEGACGTWARPRTPGPIRGVAPCGCYAAQHFPEPCCDRDTNSDGSCDRHPPGDNT